MGSAGVRSAPGSTGQGRQLRAKQAGRSGLQMSSWPGTVIPRRRTSSASRDGVSKASEFPLRLMNRVFPVPGSQPTATELLNSSRRYGFGTVFRSISHLLRHFPSSAVAWRHSLLLRTLFPARVITVVVPAKWHCNLWHWPRLWIYGHVNRSYLLTC